MVRTCILLLSVFTALSGFTREVKVSYYRYGDYHGQKADGTRTGFGYDGFEMLARKAGWTNRYVGFGRSWSEMPGMVESGEIDILDCVRKTPERERLYEYSAQPIGYSFGIMLVRAGETRYAAGGYANWGRVRVGSMAGGCVGGEFRDYASLHGFEVELVEFRTEEDVLGALGSGEVDMAIVESTFYNGSARFRSVGEFSPNPCYLCTKKGNKALMAEIDRAMEALYEENPAWYVELRRRHFPIADVVVYLPRVHVRDEVQRRYIAAMTYLLAAIGNWNPVFRDCAADYSDADFSVPCVVAHVHRSPDELKRFDFPFVPVCRRPVYLACDPADARFSNGVPRSSAALKVGYDRSEQEWLRCFRDYAAHRNLSYRLVPFGSDAELRRAVLSPEVDLAVLGIDPKGSFRRVEECGSVEFDFATPKSQPALRHTLDMSTRYIRYHEGAFIRKLEKYAYGITDAGRVVRAGVYAELGAVEIGEDGRVSGFIADYLREVSRHAKWDLIFVPMTYSEAFDCLTAGEIDIVASANYRPETSRAYDIAQRDTGIVRYALKVKASSKLRPNRPDLWTGNRIGYLARSHPVDELRRYLDGIGANYRLVPYTRIQDAVSDVLSGTLDGIYTLHARESRDFRTIAVFPALHSYFCINRNRPDVKRDLDAAMDYFASNNIDFNWWLSNLYLRGTREILMLDPDEIAYVRRNRGRKVVVGFPETVDPISHFDEKTGRFSGFLVTLFGDIAEKAGFDVEFTGAGKADVYVTQRESMDGRDDLIRDREWYALPTVRVALPDSRIPPSVRGIWAVEAKRRDEIEYLRHNSFQVRTYPSRFECYRAVARGEVEATIDNSGTARLMIDDHREFNGLQDSRIDASRWARQVALSFPPDVDPELRSILVKSRTAINPSGAEKMMVDAVVDCRQQRFSSEDLVHYGVITGVLVAVLLVFGYAVMYVRRQQEAARARTKFFFNVSHDVRTPIHAIMGLVDIGLCNLGNQARIKDCLMKTKEASGLLLSLIKSVLDMSRIEAGKVKVDETVGDVYLSFVNIESTLQEIAHEKGVSLSFGFGEISDRYVYADYEMCSRIFVNIITNAVKYTKRGGRIEVSCEQVGGGKRSAGPVASYRYTISDNGVGMSEKFQKKLYEKFSREKNTTMSGVSGLGLGMAIVKSFVDILGGRIECTSRPGEGTTFAVTLPFRLQNGSKYIDPMTGAVRDRDDERRRADAGTPVPVPARISYHDRFKGRRALLVDDSKLNREVACHYLRQAGFEVETAENGQEAVEKVVGNGGSGSGSAAAAAGRGYDVVLMDIQMPVMDGHEAARAIRRWENGRSRIPIIAWTANAFDEDLESALAAGMNGHVAKGVKINVLLEELARYLGTGEHDATTAL